MTANAKKISINLNDIFAILPDSKKEFLLGYAEGVLAMTEDQHKSTSDTQPTIVHTTA